MLTAVVKLSGVSDDLREVVAVKAVDADDKSIAGVTVNPNTVEVTIPIRKTKTVRIEPVLEGQPSRDWEITDISQNRETVVIYGEASVLQTIDSIKTKPVVLTGTNENTSFNVGLIIPEGVATVDNISSVTVYVRGTRIVNREMLMNKINFTGIGEGLRILEGEAAPSVRITVRGREDIVNGITVGDVAVTANLNGLGQGKHSVTLGVTLPESVQLIAIAPQRVEVELAAVDED